MSCAAALFRAECGDRAWIMLSLFNGVDGFLLGLEKACESLWLIDKLRQHVATTTESVVEDGVSNGRSWRMRKLDTIILDESELLGLCLADLRCLAKEYQVGGLINAWWLDDHGCSSSSSSPSSSAGAGAGSGGGDGGRPSPSPPVAVGCPWLPHGLIFVSVIIAPPCSPIQRLGDR
jgi:hypothetical protein